jgi:hypothetical protein
LELLFEIYFFRLGEPIEIGGRVSYLLEEQRFVPDFMILGISF